MSEREPRGSETPSEGFEALIGSLDNPQNADDWRYRYQRALEATARAQHLEGTSLLQTHPEGDE